MNSHFHSAKQPEEGPFRPKKFFALFPSGTSKNQSENPFVKETFTKNVTVPKNQMRTLWAEKGFCIT